MAEQDFDKWNYADQDVDLVMQVSVMQAKDKALDLIQDFNELMDDYKLQSDVLDADFRKLPNYKVKMTRKNLYMGCLVDRDDATIREGLGILVY